MAKLLGNYQNKTHISKREALEGNYSRSVSNLLLVVVFSVINVILLVAQSNSYFLFSAFVPYFIVDFGMLLTGMYPQEYYQEIGDFIACDKSLLYIAIVIAVVIISIYLLSWIFARKKKIGWLYVATVLFVIDTLAMFAITGFSMDSIFDIIFHIWVLYCLVNGIVTYHKIKKLPVEEEDSVNLDTEVEQNQSNVIRMADMQEKSRILLEAETMGYHIVYRRVKKVNELIVNGRVYDEYEATLEYPHSLTAMVDGHKIEAKYNPSSFMYIYFDDNRLVKKFRMF